MSSQLISHRLNECSKSGLFSDLTLRSIDDTGCGRVFRVHQVVFSATLGVLQKMLPTLMMDQEVEFIMPYRAVVVESLVTLVYTGQTTVNSVEALFDLHELLQVLDFNWPMQLSNYQCFNSRKQDCHVSNRDSTICPATEGLQTTESELENLRECRIRLRPLHDELERYRLRTGTSLKINNIGNGTERETNACKDINDTDKETGREINSVIGSGITAHNEPHKNRLGGEIDLFAETEDTRNRLKPVRSDLSTDYFELRDIDPFAETDVSLNELTCFNSSKSTEHTQPAAAIASIKSRNRPARKPVSSPCSACGKVIYDTPTLHRMWRYYGARKCDKCGLEFRNEVQLRLHLSGGKCSPKCQRCTFATLSEQQLQDHVQSRLGIGLGCGRRLHTGEKVATAVLERRNVATVVLGGRKVATAVLGGRKVAIAVLGGRKVATAVLGGRKVATVGGLTAGGQMQPEHRRITTGLARSHTDKRPCLICGRVFRSLGELRDHTAQHNGTAPLYKCMQRWCVKAYHDKHHAIAHMNEFKHVEEVGASDDVLHSTLQVHRAKRVSSQSTCMLVPASAFTIVKSNADFCRINSKRGGFYFCRRCHALYSSYDTLAVHFLCSWKHFNYRRCVCGQRLSSAAQLAEHYQKCGLESEVRRLAAVNNDSSETPLPAAAGGKDTKYDIAETYDNNPIVQLHVTDVQQSVHSGVDTITGDLNENTTEHPNEVQTGTDVELANLVTCGSNIKTTSQCDSELTRTNQDMGPFDSALCYTKSPKTHKDTKRASTVRSNQSSVAVSHSGNVNYRGKEAFLTNPKLFAEGADKSAACDEIVNTENDENCSDVDGVDRRLSDDSGDLDMEVVIDAIDARDQPRSDESENETITSSSNAQNQQLTKQSGVNAVADTDGIKLQTMSKENDDDCLRLAISNQIIGSFDKNQAGKDQHPGESDLINLSSRSTNVSALNLYVPRVVKQKSAGRSSKHWRFYCEKCDKHLSDSPNMHRAWCQYRVRKCQPCNAHFKNISNLQHHIRICQSLLKCDVCPLQTLSEQQLLDHSENKHAGFSGKQSPCPVCGKLFRQQSEYKEHIAKHDGTAPLFKCINDNCIKACYDMKYLYEHMNEMKHISEVGMPNADLLSALQIVKAKMNNHSCFLVPPSSFVTIDLRENFKPAIGPSFYFCRKCTELYSSYESLQIHVLWRHYGIRMCVNCDIKFTNIDHVGDHFSKCYSFSFNCQHCGSVSQSFEDLQRHMSNFVTARGWFQCHQCSLTFQRNSSWLAHSSVHTGEKQFVCEICDKRFRTKGALTCHMNYHLGIRNFSCSYCEKKFTAKLDLQRHIWLHQGIKQFQCHHCEMSFTLKGSLTKHMPHCHGNKSE